MTRAAEAVDHTETMGSGQFKAELLRWYYAQPDSVQSRITDEINEAHEARLDAEARDY